MDAWSCVYAQENRPVVTGVERNVVEGSKYGMASGHRDSRPTTVVPVEHLTLAMDNCIIVVVDFGLTDRAKAKWEVNCDNAIA